MLDTRGNACWFSDTFVKVPGSQLVSFWFQQLSVAPLDLHQDLHVAHLHVVLLVIHQDLLVAQLCLPPHSAPIG